MKGDGLMVVVGTDESERGYIVEMVCAVERKKKKGTTEAL